MYRQTIGYVFRIYLGSIAYWVGLITEVIRTVLLRIVAVIITSSLAGYVAVGDTDKALEMVVLFVVVGSVGIIIGAIGDLIAILGENTVYHKMSIQFYSRLISKDLSFYKDQHTGYLTTAFRQHLDSAILIARTLRVDLMRIVITIAATTATLTWYSPKVGLAVLAVIVL